MLVHDLIWRGRPDDIALRAPGRSMTYRALILSVALCRARLYAGGVRIYDRVALFSQNRIEYVVAYMAIASLGAVVVPVNAQFNARETAIILKNADARRLIADRPLDLAPALDALGHARIETLDIAECVKPFGSASAPALPEDFGPDEPCAILYTAAGDGTPRGVVLSHRNLLMNVISVRQAIGLSRGDKLLCVLPMHRAFAWTCAVLGALYAGASAAIIEGFTPDRTVEAIRAHHITAAVLVPSICAFLAKFAKPEDLRTLRLVLLGGAPLPVSVGRAFQSKFNLPLLESYGLPEASPVVTINPPDAPRPGSVGLPIPNVRVRIADARGREAAPGEEGELLVQGPGVMHGYLGQPDATAEALRDGWLHTGDRARADADGYLYLADRAKDRILVMGEPVCPREIETLLYAYPGIREAAVLPIEDALRGHAVRCCYSTAPDAAVDTSALQTYLRQNLAPFKLPRELHRLDQLPRTADGRIDKEALRKKYEKENEPK